MKTGRTARRALAAATITAAMLAAPAVSRAAVNVGQSGWYWGNPLPQGVDLDAVDFAANPAGRGYAVGDFGVVLRTDNGGATWSGLASGTGNDLRHVQAVGPEALVVGGGCTLRRSEDGGASFTNLTFTREKPTCEKTLAAMHFASATAGYLALNDGTVFATADGGRTFSRRTALPGGQAPTDVETAGLALVATTAGGAPGSGTILRSVDGAGSWETAATPPAGLRGLTFVDAEHGFAVGDNSLVLKTDDGGKTWEATEGSVPGAPLRLRTIRCASATTCLIVSDDGRAVVRTADGGEEFTVLPAATPVPGLDFASATRLVAVGDGGATVISEDAGLTFGAVNTRLTGSFSRIEAGPGEAIAFALGADGALARTNDGGRTWQPVGASTSAAIRDVAFPTSNVGFALGDDGGLLRTDNGGASYRILDPGEGRAPRAVVALDDDRVLLLGPKGVRRSTDGGSTFAAVPDRIATRTAITDGEAAAGAAVAWGPSRLILSTDGGQKWTEVKRPSKAGIRAADFVNATSGWLLDSRGLLFSTRTGGRKWTETLSTGIGGNDPYDMAFGSLSRGYLLTRSGGLLRTSDAGRTWRPQVVTQGELSDIAAGPGGADYALQAPGRLFGTDTGGDQGANAGLSLKTKSSRLAKTTRVTVTGRLSPPLGGESVAVSARSKGRWTRQVVDAQSDGTFTTTWTVKRTTVFVAQWAGDDDRSSAGSPPLIVTVGSGK